jgi:hypothetical protein
MIKTEKVHIEEKNFMLNKYEKKMEIDELWKAKNDSSLLPEGLDSIFSRSHFVAILWLSPRILYYIYMSHM